jgi:Zn-dependent protease/CBS domain-containing protein
VRRNPAGRAGPWEAAPSIEGVDDRPRRTDAGAGLLIGRPFGVPVYLAPTWFLVAALITVSYATVVEARLPQIGAWKYAVSLSFALLLYLSVLVHELSHTVVALRAGLPVRRISLHLLGGVSEIERPSPTPAREAWIAAAGPLTSLALAAGCWVVSQFVLPGTAARMLVDALAWSNAAVGVFNLLPGLPLDGGRVVQAAIWKLTGRRSTGAVAAAWAGRAVAVLIGIAPVLLATRHADTSAVDLIWGPLLGWFIWTGATQSLAFARIQARVPGLAARNLTRRAVPAAADLPLAEALRRAEAAGAAAIVVVTGDGRPVGIVVESRVRRVPEARRPWETVGDLSRRLEPEMVVSAELTGERLVEAIADVAASEFLVVEATGEIYGVLSTTDVERAMAQA